MFSGITVGLKGWMLPVASVAVRLLKLGGCAPDCGLARPALRGPGCKLAAHAGESDWLALCDCQWPLALCQWASGFGGAGLRVSPSSESSGVVFLLVGVPALCPVQLSVPAHWQWQRRRPARCGGTGVHRIWRRRQRQWRRSVGRRRSQRCSVA